MVTWLQGAFALCALNGCLRQVRLYYPQGFPWLHSDPKFSNLTLYLSIWPSCFQEWTAQWASFRKSQQMPSIHPFYHVHYLNNIFFFQWEKTVNDNIWQLPFTFCLILLIQTHSLLQLKSNATHGIPLWWGNKHMNIKKLNNTSQHFNKALTIPQVLTFKSYQASYVLRCKYYIPTGKMF